MNAPGQKDKFTPELRILVASLLSFGVIILWAKFFGPKPSVQPMPTNRPAETAPAVAGPATRATANPLPVPAAPVATARSEEHTSELQSHVNLVCRLLLEKKKKKQNRSFHLNKKKK